MIEADSRGRAKSSEIESSEQRRKRMLKNKRQREMWGPVHRRRRVQFARRIERGEVLICPRCGLPIGPDQEWDLGHDDWNPRIEARAPLVQSRRREPVEDVAGVVSAARVLPSVELSPDLVT